MIKVQSSTSGFTLIELLIVFAIIGILSIKGMAALVDYSRSQTLNTAALDLVTMLQQAKNRAASQVKPDICGTLDGYKVTICNLPGLYCQDSQTYAYAMYAVCTSAGVSVPVFIDGKKFPTGISWRTVGFGATDTTTTSVLFRVITGGITGNGNMVLVGYNNIKKITVDSAGNIVVN